MTANKKMTEYWKKVLEILPVNLYGTLWSERRNSLHILLKETYQAGRAEMAEECAKIADNHECSSACDDLNGGTLCAIPIREDIKRHAQRDGGEKK